MTVILNRSIGQFEIFNFNFSVNFHESVKKKMKIGEELTNQKAIEIFKQIKFKSDVLSFLTHSCFVFSVGLGLLIGGICIPPTSLSLIIVGTIASSLGGGILGFSIPNTLNGFLPLLSQAYKTQSQMAAEHIRKVESENASFILQ